MVRRVLVLRNASASGGEVALDDALRRLGDGGIEAQVLVPESPEHMRFLIRAEARSIDGVVVGGGDGTINAALKPVLEAGLPLGILPLGTANDLARTLGVPTDVFEACALIASQQTRDIDIGWANDRPFVNAAGIGLSTRVARELSAHTKRLLGPLSYASAVMEAFRRQRPFRAVIRSASGIRKLPSIQITVGNGVHYGGGTPLGEDCAIDDGRFDLFSVRPQMLTRLAAVALAVRRGAQEHFGAGVDTLRGTEFEISTRPKLSVSLDGEPALQTPVRFRLASRALTVFAPQRQARGRATRAASRGVGIRRESP